ncbi:hypothetical protein BC936DRAFT_142652 [Jimgerdemannia flammicorona]|uniref:Uncharacterized protein n=1 Tax=Jimgerdemannia flammicorona TaxID=994334 RepID=A0A433A036_9FUNG|nr:hypothetical protein BC936DRAFT_142652 [Jimgerdemannia flammicorona]
MPTETVQQTHRNAATARAANCWDNLHDPETAHKVAGAFDDAHFVPERMHPKIYHALLTSTSPKPPLLSLVHLTNSVSSTPFTFLTLTSRAPPPLYTRTPRFRILVTRLRLLCSHELRDPDLLHDMYQHVYGQIPAFPMTIIADDGISTWGYFSCWDYLVQMVMGGLEFETDRNEDDMQSITDCEEVLMEGTLLVENVERMHPFTLPPLDPKPLPPIPPPVAFQTPDHRTATW